MAGAEARNTRSHLGRGGHLGPVCTWITLGWLLRETDPSVVTCGLPTLRPVPDCQLEKDDVGLGPTAAPPGGRLVPDELASDERVPDEYGDYSPDPCQVNLCLVGVGVAPPDLCPMSVSSPSPSH